MKVFQVFVPALLITPPESLGSWILCQCGELNPRGMQATHILSTVHYKGINPCKFLLVVIRRGINFVHVKSVELLTLLVTGYLYLDLSSLHFVKEPWFGLEGVWLCFTLNGSSYSCHGGLLVPQAGLADLNAASTALFFCIM